MNKMQFNQDSSLGIIYCAIGKKYLKKAELSYRSALQHNPELKASIYTDQITKSEFWEDILPAKPIVDLNADAFMIYKLDAILKSPYEKCLYLDADTYIHSALLDLFDLLNFFDLAFCHGHNRNKRLKKWNAFKLSKELGLNSSIPDSFTAIQGGVILFRKRATLNYFRQVKECYVNYEYFDDQIIMRELLLESALRFYILSPEFNYNSGRYLARLVRTNYREATPKIFHYTKTKGKNIENLVNRIVRRNSNWLIRLISKYILRE